MESFLRGCNGNLQVYQLFVAHTGLLHTLISQHINNTITKPNNIQITYDLLGQIIKANKANILLVDKICLYNDWHEALFAQIVENVVDSNVFLRSLLLSLEKCEYVKAKMVGYFLLTDTVNHLPHRTILR